MQETVKTEDRQTVLSTSVIVERVLSLDNPVEAFARKYVDVYGDCVDDLEKMLLGLKIGGKSEDTCLSAKFSQNIGRLVKLDDICMSKYIKANSVVDELCKIGSAILGSDDYGSCSLLLDDLRGRPAARYVDDDDLDGLDDDAVREPDLMFISHENMLPRHYTAEMSGFVREIDEMLLSKIDEAVARGATDLARSMVVRDLVVDACNCFPRYGIHRILSGAVLPCVPRLHAENERTESK